MGVFRKTFAKTATRVVINGVQYDSIDEVPKQFRQLLEDADADGCPDWVQRQAASMGGLASASTVQMATTNGVTTYRVGDKEYRTLEEMPPEHRALFEDADGDGWPDKFPRMRRLAIPNNASQMADARGKSPEKHCPTREPSTPGWENASSTEQASPEELESSRGWPSDDRNPWDHRRSVRAELEPGESSGSGAVVALLLTALVLAGGALAFLVARLL
ncbi:MAG: hypothetical protein ACYTG0_09740 [Planctomycetota bacterium]|jgi:hypothetical protein